MRGGFKIERSGNYEYERAEKAPSWLKEFAAKVEEPKTAVEVARERNNASGPSFADRINAIMNGTPTSPYSSVDEAVQDYQKRTGLLEYRKMALAQEIIDAGNAADDEKKNEKPELLERYPSIEHYVRNVVDSQYGIQLPAIIQGILETFGREVKESDLDSELYHWINDLLKNRLSDRHQNNDYALGRGIGTETTTYDVHDGNRDPFLNLMPNKLI